MNKFVIELTDEEVEKLGEVVDMPISDDSDMEYCIKAIIATMDY